MMGFGLKGTSLQGKAGSSLKELVFQIWIILILFMGLDTPPSQLVSTMESTVSPVVSLTELNQHPT